MADMNRRSFLRGIGSLAAPAIITTPGLLMPIKALVASPALVLPQRLVSPGVTVVETDITQTFEWLPIHIEIEMDKENLDKFNMIYKTPDGAVIKREGRFFKEDKDKLSQVTDEGLKELSGPHTKSFSIKGPDWRTLNVEKKVEA
jgi:hypothetical protein